MNYELFKTVVPEELRFPTGITILGTGLLYMMHQIISSFYPMFRKMLLFKCFFKTNEPGQQDQAMLLRTKLGFLVPQPLQSWDCLSHGNPCFLLGLVWEKTRAGECTDMGDVTAESSDFLSMRTYWVGNALTGGEFSFVVQLSLLGQQACRCLYKMKQS